MYFVISVTEDGNYYHYFRSEDALNKFLDEQTDTKNIKPEFVPKFLSSFPDYGTIEDLYQQPGTIVIIKGFVVKPEPITVATKYRVVDRR